LPLPAGVDPKWVEECARDLGANRGASLVLAGHRQPPAVHILASLLNSALGNQGRTVFFSELPQTPTTDDLAGLVAALNAGQVDTLVILGANPAYTAPAGLNWNAARAKAREVIRLGYYEDESFAGCTWHLPAAHYLESWGDARTSDGSLVPIQPLIAPLYGGLTEIEVLARLGGLEQTRSYDIARETFRIFAGDAGFEEKWKKFLHDGYFPLSAPKSADAPVPADRVAAAFASVTATAPGKDNLEVVFHRDYSLDDGRWSNNGWLQELPDPITKIVWDNVILVSRKTAEELGVTNTSTKADLVEVELGGRKIQGPVWVQPGMADYSLGLACGYGRIASDKGGTGRVGHEVGRYNAYALQASSGAFAVGARVRKLGETYPISCTQEHGSMEGRPIVREANKEQFEKFSKFAKNMDLEAHAGHIATDPKTGLPRTIYEHPYAAYDSDKRQVGIDLKPNQFKSEVHQWGMSVDLNACVGCAACVVACQSENNIPIVGKDQVARNREMHWLRIDRYYSGASDHDRAQRPSAIDDPQVLTQPMLCQHCEAAPCESVCPVNATAHDEEGLNVMAYNRCVGTRYCSNNCPYKVRRFNFFDYHKHPLKNLYQTPLVSRSQGRWNLLNWWKEPSLHHTVPDDQWNLLALVKNPDVSVRMRGVMEKCTFCVQRIEQAKIAQKNKAGQSGDVAVPDGSFTTACAQACPTEAIVFGNLLDPHSRVSQLKRQERDYTVLGFLDTRPRVTYLARVRNPNKNMPDYHETPLNIQEYVRKQGSPFEPHAIHGAGDASHGETKGGH
ncbi:MAG TPA: 4Fe-4S dicluster domain-containing protein, partial [Methylomirabilota bacterium]|nr:4Fe-4S dicluster domain-containing protein [Methylomirabilota bacterium]